MNLKENKLKVIKWGFIALISIIFAVKCDSIIDSTKALIKPSNSFIDTVKTHTRDTIWAKDTIITPPIVIKSNPIVIHDTILKPASIDTLEMYKFFTYKDTIKDSNIDIYRDATTQGKTLRYNKISYKLKVPLKIIDSKTLIITKTDTSYRQPKYSINIGTAVGTQLLCPMAEFTIDKHTFGAGYNLQTNSPVIKYSFRLWSSKKR